MGRVFSAFFSKVEVFFPYTFLFFRKLLGIFSQVPITSQGRPRDVTRHPKNFQVSICPNVFENRTRKSTCFDISRRDRRVINEIASKSITLALALLERSIKITERGNNSSHCWNRSCRKNHTSRRSVKNITCLRKPDGMWQACTDAPATFFCRKLKDPSQRFFTRVRSNPRGWVSFRGFGVRPMFHFVCQ